MSDCPFCRIVRHEIPATIVQEDEQAIAFRDVNPQAPTHILVVPKKTHRLTRTMRHHRDRELLGHLLLLARENCAQGRGHLRLSNRDQQWNRRRPERVSSPPALAGRPSTALATRVMVLFLGKSFRLVAEADPSAGPVWNGEAFKGLLRNRKLQPNPSTFPKQSDWP